MPLRRFRPNVSVSRDKAAAGSNQQPTRPPLPAVNDQSRLESSQQQEAVATSPTKQQLEQPAELGTQVPRSSEGESGEEQPSRSQSAVKVQRLRKKIPPRLPSGARGSRPKDHQPITTSTPSITIPSSPPLQTVLAATTAGLPSPPEADQQQQLAVAVTSPPHLSPSLPTDHTDITRELTPPPTERTDQSSPQQQEDTPCIREVPTLDSESSCSPRKGQRSQQKAKSGKGPSGRRKGGSGKSVSDTPATAAGNKRGRGKRLSTTPPENGTEGTPTKKRRTRASAAASDKGGEAVQSFREAPDRSTMTMQDLIYYNPSSNPMTKKAEQEKRKKSSRPTTPTAPQTATPTTSEQPPLAEGEEEDPGRIVPALCIGADGLIMINESSMLVESSHLGLMDDNREIIEEDSNNYTTSTSFRQRNKITKWTREETGKFYKALSQVGTDFTMMTLLLPKRSRKELKNKFKKEEKSNPARVTETLSKLCSSSPTKNKS